jgi:hypothetical protein
MVLLIPSWNLLLECEFDPIDLYDNSMFMFIL